jgi:hypothetical protein
MSGMSASAGGVGGGSVRRLPTLPKAAILRKSIPDLAAAPRSTDCNGSGFHSTVLSECALMPCATAGTISDAMTRASAANKRRQSEPRGLVNPTTF